MKDLIRKEGYTAVAILFAVLYINECDSQGFYEIDEDEDIEDALMQKFGDALLADKLSIYGDLKKDTLYFYSYDNRLYNGVRGGDFKPNGIVINKDGDTVFLYEIIGVHTDDLRKT